MSEYLTPLAAAILPNVGGFLGGFLTKKETRSSPGQITWYQALKKPKLTPPSYIIAPVWTGLYCSMGYASYMVWRDGDGFDGKAALPLACYGTQLALNWAWPPIYFKAHKIGLMYRNIMPINTPVFGRGALRTSRMHFENVVPLTASSAISLKSPEQWQKNNKRGSSINGVSTIEFAATLQATIEIGALWGAVVATIVTFHKVNPTASYMLLPYLAWVSFASYLTFSTWRLNKDRKD